MRTKTVHGQQKKTSRIAKKMLREPVSFDSPGHTLADTCDKDKLNISH